MWAGPAVTAQAAESCGEIAFTPGTTVASSSYGVGDIMATDVSCDVARSVAGAVQQNQGTSSYSASGFQCSGTATATAPGARKDWTCSRATKFANAAKSKKKKKKKKKQPTQLPPATVTFFSIGV